MRRAKKKPKHASPQMPAQPAQDGEQEQGQEQGQEQDELQVQHVQRKGRRSSSRHGGSSDLVALI
jgi:hypothetical protein